MAQQWVDITTIDNNTPFSAVRWLGTFNIGGDVWFSEASGLTTDGMAWTDGTSEYGWFSAHRMNSNQYSCSFIHTGDTYWNEEGTAYRDHVKDAPRNESGFYDTTVEIGEETFYEVDFSLWSGATGYQLYAPFSLMPWSAGEVYVLVGLPDIYVRPEEADFVWSGGTSAVTLTSNESWTATTFVNWVHVSTMSGPSGDTVVTVSADTYSGTGETRATNVMFEYRSNPAINTVLRVEQTPPSIEPDKAKLSFKVTGGTGTITITSDEPWSATTAANWLTLSDTTGDTGSTTITVTADTYTGGSANRTSTIDFALTSGFNSTSVQVIQKYKAGVDGLLIGTEAVEGLYLGTEEVEAMYIGNVQIF